MMATTTITTPAAADSTNSPRDRLQALIKAAGYGRDVLEAIADATLHPHQPKPGEKATDPQLRRICDAVDVLMTAGRSSAQVLTRINGFRDAGGDWRFEFWQAELAEANRRWNLQQDQASGRASEEDIQTIRGLAGVADLSDEQLLGMLTRAAAPGDDSPALTDLALQQLPAAAVPGLVGDLRTAAAERLAAAARRAATDLHAAAYGA